ncbi:hypothetical protein [Planktotalea sp.]|uniref:hypothetical protein n=1 Tax=Planktotalea sp. TaxID=2029877 RepID=UPI00329859E7
MPEALHDVISAEEGYVVATGTLSFNERKLPKVDMARQDKTPPTTRIQARLKGKALTKSGFTHDLNTRLTLEVKCYGPWCARPASGKAALTFLKQTENGYELSTNPCGGHIFVDPSRETLDSVAQCYLTGKCPKSQFR